MTPWDALEDEPFFAKSSIPGMISPEERKMLLWAARDHWVGAGEIVEIGAFAGLSTSYLAEGIRRNERCPYKKSRLHVYELFQIDDDNAASYLRFLPQLEPDFRGSFQYAFERHTDAWKEFISVHPGDTYDAAWSGKPIELLFIDCSISRHFHEMLFQKFYPSLIPSQALLIHQDFFYHRSYYLAPMMKKLREYFEIVGNAETSMAYRCVRPLDGELFRRPLFDTTDEMLDMLQQAIADFGGQSSPAGGVLATSLIYFHATHGRRDRAQELAAELGQRNSDERVLQNLRDALAP